ncbi:MAG: hypothetical protein Q7S50_02530 [bacterium]|nr:hypothetical protein [bacterium]
MHTSLNKTVAATITFALAGLISLLFFAAVSVYLLPHSIFYAVLVLNTFFSIRFFSRLIAPSPRQTAVDAILVVLYIILAYSLGNAFAFPLVATCLFLVATAKYVIELDSNPHVSVLKRKISLDLLGAALCAATLGGVLAGNPLASAWILAAVFAAANVYLLFIRPMYRL